LWLYLREPPGGLGALGPAMEEIRRLKEALADAAEIQFGLETFMSGKDGA